MKIFEKDAENTFYKKGFPQIKTVKTYIDRFMTGDWFFPFCGAFAFAAWTAGRYWPYALHTAVSLFALAIAYTLFFGQSTAPAVPVIAMTVYMLPLGFKYEDAKGFAWLGLWLVPIVAGFVWFFIKHKPKFKKSRIFWPTVAFAAAMPLSGLLSPWYTGSVNLTIIFYFMLMYPFVAVLLFNTSKLTLEYVAKTIVTAGAVVVLEMIVYYAGAEDFQATFSGKQLGLGWGISNDVSVVVMMAVPAAFYLALGAGKADAAYLAAAFVFLFATAFTMSRGCILLLAAALPFLIWAYLAQSAPETRKRRAWTVAAVAGASLAVGLIAVSQLSGMIEYWKAVGLKENGRIGIYKEAIELFLDRPLFGVGYDYPTQLIARDPVYPAHNTILQFLASGGIVGLFACLYMFGSRYLLFYGAWKPRHVFFLIAMLLFDIYALFELAMFLPYVVFLTCVIFNALEQDNGDGEWRKMVEWKWRKWRF